MSDSITEPIGAYSVTTSKALIEREAIDAALAGISINDACPYPFGSQRANHFKLAYRVCQTVAAHVERGAAAAGGAGKA